jgi:hypothetical protein
MVQAIAQVAGERGDSMSAVVREAVRAYISLDDDDRPLRQTAGSEGMPAPQQSEGNRERFTIHSY